MELSDNQLSFLKKADEARDYAFSFNDPLLIHHYDADGCAAAALVVAAFAEKKRKIRRFCIKKLDDTFIENIIKKGEKEAIFVDLGSGNLRVNEIEEALIIDHHQPLKAINKMQVNPLLFNIDGGDELSAASTAFCVFRIRVDLGITGAVADMQSPLHGMNRFVLEQGIKNKEVVIEKDLCFYGRFSRPLVQFILYNDDPYIPSLSFIENRCIQLLESIKIPVEKNGKWRTYSDLSEEEKIKLVSSIVEISSISSKELIGESYIFPNHQKNETYEANEFSTLLNACGRHNASDVAVSVCLNELGSYEIAKQLLQQHRQQIRNGIIFAKEKVSDFGKFYFLDGRDSINEAIIGIICGMLFTARLEKPILGIAKGEEETIKVSSRANKRLVSQGVNLGKTIRKTAESVGGIGGGHKIAAGASIPKTKLNEFLSLFGLNLAITSEK